MLELPMQFHTLRRLAAGLLLLPLLATAQSKQATPPSLQLPVEYYTLPNGLRVVLSQDKSAPLVSVGVYYGIGFRIEPKDRTGFAHLFEHLMFQGSGNLGKMEFIKLIEANGGVLNGSTRFDFTNYYETVPAHKLETILWAEADRMAGLRITEENLKNQQDVVKNEVRVNVLNQPYGGFPWIDLPMAANTNWYNAHNFYGDLEDLDAATIQDASDFFRKYYTPSNAVLAVVGDFETAEAKQFVEKYFGKLTGPKAEALPDIREPRQTEEKRAGRVDPLAPLPRAAVGYHMPERGTPEYWAMILLEQALTSGRDAKLYRHLVADKKLATNIAAGINWGLGNAFNYNGPMLYTIQLNYNDTNQTQALLAEHDVALKQFRDTELNEATLARALIKFRNGFYDEMQDQLSRIDYLATGAMFNNDPRFVNSIEANLRKVDVATARRAFDEYLRPSNRTIYLIKPGVKPQAANAPATK